MWGDNPAIPIYSVNNSVGLFLRNNHCTTTVSGDLTQVFKQQTESTPGVTSYNVVAYRDGIDNSKTMIINNRLDNWWNPGPGDSGAGGAIVLGLAKYFNDNHITPKINLTFLFTTGEEYGNRGGF